VETFWELFEEENYFFKFFQLFFEIFEYNWCIFESLEEASFTRVFCETEEMIAALLANCPNTIADIKAQWEDRLKEEQEVMEIVPSTTTVNKAENDSNSIISGIPRHLTQPKNPHTVDNSSEKNPKKNSFCFKIEEYTNKLMHVSSILSLEQVAQIDRVIPITCQLCKWKLLYSNDLHGSSLDSLLMLSKNQSPTLLVIQDDQGNVFGGFASDEWHTAQQYYGNGETFLFTFSGMDSAFVKYPWSRKNNYFMLCSKESIVMGGGGSFGLYLDADLSHGTTGLCETFSSKPLVPSQEFGVIHIEVWGFSISGVESTALDKRSSIRDF
jgi:hypothetical protein